MKRKFTWSLEKSVVVEKEALTTLTSAWAVLHCLMAAAARGDMKVRFARAAVTNRNVSSPPFRRERPEVQNCIF